VYRPFGARTKLPKFEEVSRKTQRVASEHDYIRSGHKMIETRADIYATRAKYEAKTGLFKKAVVEERFLTKHSQKATTKASQVVKGEHLRGTLQRPEGITRRTAAIKTKGTHPELKFGKLKPPKDSAKVLGISQRVPKPYKKGIKQEILHVKTLRGSRIVKTTEHKGQLLQSRRSVAEKGTFFRGVGRALGRPFKGKKAQLSMVPDELIKRAKRRFIESEWKGADKEPVFGRRQPTPKFEKIVEEGVSIGGKIRPRPTQIPVRYGKITPSGVRLRSTARPRLVYKTAKVQRTEPSLKLQPATRSDVRTITRQDVKVTPTQELKPIQRTEQVVKQEQILRQRQIQRQKLTTGTITPTIPGISVPKVPPPHIPIVPPPIVPPTFKMGIPGVGLGTRVLGKRLPQPKEYKPSAFAAAFKITGSPTKFGVKTGLGLRPITGKKKKKSSRSIL
jgi:hypothetical protein